MKSNSDKQPMTLEQVRDVLRAGTPWPRFIDGKSVSADEMADAIDSHIARKVGVTDEAVDRALNVRVGSFPVMAAISGKAVRAILESFAASLPVAAKVPCNLQRAIDYLQVMVCSSHNVGWKTNREMWAVVRDAALLAQGTEKREQAGVSTHMVLSVAENLRALGWSSGGDYLDDFVPDVRRALEAVIPSRVPEGWKLVPVEPTDWMVGKGTECHTCEQMDGYYCDTELSDRDCVEIYKAMLAAAPQPDTDKE